MKRRRLRGGRLWGASQRLREQIGASLSPTEQEEQEHLVAAAVREAIGGEEAFNAAWTEGSPMALEQAVVYALAEPGAVG